MPLAGDVDVDVDVDMDLDVLALLGLVRLQDSLSRPLFPSFIAWALHFGALLPGIYAFPGAGWRSPDRIRRMAEAGRF